MWFALALLTAFFSATEAAFLKRFLSHRSSWEMASYPLLYGLPIFLATVLVLPVPVLQPGFWWVVAVLTPLNIAGFLLHMHAIHESPISLTMPLQSFTPAFVILTGYVLLGETLNPWGIGGILCIALGSYVLNIGGNGAKRTLLSPFRALMGDTGARCMMGAALIYALCSVLGKLMILKSSPLYAGVVFFTIFSVSILAGLRLTGRIRFRNLRSRPWRGILIGSFFYLHILCHHLAISMAKAAYMMAIKRLNGLFSVLYGGLLFKEENFGFRLAGAGLMTTGAAVIALWG